MPVVIRNSDTIQQFVDKKADSRIVGRPVLGVPSGEAKFEATDAVGSVVLLVPLPVSCIVKELMVTTMTGFTGTGTVDFGLAEFKLNQTSPLGTVLDAGFFNTGFNIVTSLSRSNVLSQSVYTAAKDGKPLWKLLYPTLHYAAEVPVTHVAVIATLTTTASASVSFNMIADFFN
jgi:hypothetical protein